MSAYVFILSLSALISHEKFQHDSSTPSWSKFEIEFTIGITMGNAPKKRMSLKRHFLMVLVQIGDNSNMTQVSVIKWSRNCTRTIRSGVVGIPKYLKNACKAGYFNIFGYAKNTTSDGPSSVLRPLYNRYFYHITIEKWSQICTKTIRNGFFKDIQMLALFPIVIPIVNIITNLDHEGVEL